jgi:hypothetical protein
MQTLTVSQLITQLQALNPDALVVLDSAWINGCWTPAIEARQVIVDSPRYAPNFELVEDCVVQCSPEDYEDALLVDAYLFT